MNKPTQIAALVSYKIFPAKMGGQKGIALFYQYLSGLLPVSIITTSNNELPNDMQVKFFPVLSNSKLRYANPFLFFKLKKILAENKCTHLILEHPYYGWLGILLKWFCHIKLVVHSHNIEATRFKSMNKWWWGIMWQYEKFTYSKADIKFFISDEDREFAIKKFSLDETKCYTITYGFEINKTTLPAEKQQARVLLQMLHHIKEGEKILFFNGTLDYKPNLDAIDSILQQINPLLLANDQFKYKIIICGKGLPAHYNELKDHVSKNIIYAGFVDDINVYFKGADIFINPVTDGGGIKTKVVESLGHNLYVVSTRSGAIGVPLAVTGNKMVIVADNEWQDFAKSIIEADTTGNIPPAFFDHFYWGNIAARVSTILNKQDNKS